MRVAAEIRNERPGASRATGANASVDQTSPATAPHTTMARLPHGAPRRIPRITCSPDVESNHFYYAPPATDVHAAPAGLVGKFGREASGKRHLEHPEVPIPDAARRGNRGRGHRIGGLMRRVLLATLLLIHGLAHASAGVWASSEGPLWLVTSLWAA